MAKVTYTGSMESLNHHGNPSETSYLFRRGRAQEVKLEDIEHYAQEERRGGPWKVDMGIVEKTAGLLKKRKGGKE